MKNPPVHLLAAVTWAFLTRLRLQALYKHRMKDWRFVALLILPDVFREYASSNYRRIN